MGPQGFQMIGEAYVGSPVHYMSVAFPLMVTAHSERLIHIWNLNLIAQNNFNPIDVVES